MGSKQSPRLDPRPLLDPCGKKDAPQDLHGQKFHATTLEFLTVEAFPLNEVDFFFHCDAFG